MTAADLGERPTHGGHGGSAPVAEISLGALHGNARLLGSGAAPLPLPADAWGHGASEVSAVLARAAGESAMSGARESRRSELATLLGLPGAAAGARPAMRLLGTVLSTKDLRAGEGVSYGLTYRASTDTRIALVTGGYAQGVVRALGNRAAVAVEGRPRPILGRVAMDVCVVGIGDDDVPRGAEAVFFGDPERGEPSLAEWIAVTGMTAQELVTAVGLRARREYVA